MTNTGAFKKGEKRPNQGKRGPSKTTLEARQAIAQFVDGNAHRLGEWLDLVARGIPAEDIKPNPAKAFELFQSVVEYHVPKLTRSDVNNNHSGSVTNNVNFNVVGVKA